MVYVLPGQIRDTLDRLLLQSPFDGRVFIKPDLSHLTSPGLVFPDDLRLVDLYFLYGEGTLDDIDVVSLVIPQICVSLSLCPEAEDIVLLNVPDVTFRKIL